MIKKKDFIILILGILIAVLYFSGGLISDWANQQWTGAQDLRQKITGSLGQGEKKPVEEVKTTKSLPPPLKVNKAVPVSYLTRTGIILETNVQRSKNNLAVLKENTRLDAAASARIDDMFKKQYFAHVSPAGEDVSSAVKITSYDYIAIGENLALGNFENDKDVLNGWMASPGHRANILDKRFQEMGAAAKKGIFEGKNTWLAVQIFAMPRSACPQPDPVLKSQIEGGEKQLTEWQKQLDDLRLQIESSNPRKDPNYNQTVESFNTLVKNYNSLVEQVKSLVDKYNGQVRSTNACIGV